VVRFEQYHTYNEIQSQPEIWVKVLSELSKTNLDDLPRFEDYEQIVFTGCGSTYYLSIWAARTLQPKISGFSRPLPGSEIMLSPKHWFPKDRKTLLVAISRSGDTSETVKAIETFKKMGIGDTMGVTCYPESQLAQLVDHVVTTAAGQESSIAQTRSFSSMMLGTAYLIIGKTNGVHGEEFADGMRSLMDTFEPSIRQIGEDLTLEQFFYLGNGPRFGLANEVMLKQKEMSLTYSEAYHFLEFRHGPMSMVNPQTMVWGLLGTDAFKYELAVMKDMKKLGGKIGVIARQERPSDWPAEDLWISLGEKSAPPWQDVQYLPLLQLLSCTRSIKKGLNPDKPVNLSAVVVLEP